MTDTDRLDRLRGIFHTGEIPLARADCLDDETVSALADGTLGAEARGPALAHMATCAYCRRAVASVAHALDDRPITHEIELAEGRRFRARRVLWIAIPLAAAATILLLLWFPRDDSEPIHRGGGSQATGPVPMGPLGSVAHASSFVWKGVVGADRYRVTLFDAQGNVLFETETPDTTMVLPDSVRLLMQRAYVWKVEAGTGSDRWTASGLVQFVIARAPPQ